MLRATTACTFSTWNGNRIVKKWSKSLVCSTYSLPNVLHATMVRTFSTSQLSKVVGCWFVLYLLPSKCASLYNSVHLFDIATSKRHPNVTVFGTFDFKICFPPQRRALFRHLNFQKWSDHVYKSVSPVNYGWFFFGERATGGTEPKATFYLPI